MPLRINLFLTNRLRRPEAQRKSRSPEELRQGGTYKNKVNEALNCAIGSGLPITSKQAHHPPMTPTITPLTHRVTFAIGDEQSARRISDLLSESLDESEAAVAAFEGPTGRWDITVHFADAPDQDTIRELVRLAAGEEAARAVQFDTVEPKDWVRATLDELVPVHAGRFVVHGQHDRAKVAPNRLGIEIEAALAFGTGHHGTTRGCLLLLGGLLKAHRPRRVLDLGTGTGVLAIAAARALRDQVLASDIDALSVKVAAENARLNGVGPFVEVTWGNGFSAPCCGNGSHSTWCWPISSPTRCGKWRHRCPGIWPAGPASSYRGYCRPRRLPSSRPIARAGSFWSGTSGSRAGAACCCIKRGRA
jgi:ribosomal protein L11 methyltransferase